MTYNPNPWARHFQAPWENHAMDDRHPLWFRLMSLAYGRHEANGHANFKRGALALILGTQTADGWCKVDRYYLRDTIRAVVERGLLAEGSCTECLVVPHHAVTGGIGDPEKPCAVHVRKRAVKHRATLRVVGEQ